MDKATEAFKGGFSFRLPLNFYRFYIDSGLQIVLMKKAVLFSARVASSFKKVTPTVKQKLNKAGLVLPRRNSVTVMFKIIKLFVGFILFCSARENCRND